MCSANPKAFTDALAWIDAFERTGGRVLCDGRMFAVTLPPEPDTGLTPPDDLTLIAAAAFFCHRRRHGLEA